MAKPVITKNEFETRISRIRQRMAEEMLDAMVIYGDEYRKENLRYVSNYWPIFDRAALLIGKSGDPLLMVAPESRGVAEETSAWQDLRSVPNFVSSYVEDTIDYPLAIYSGFGQLKAELEQRDGKLNRLGIVGVDAMCGPLYNQIRDGFGCELVNADHMLYQMREIKSPLERDCLREAGRIAQEGIRELLKHDLVGMSETEACGIAEAAARKAGAEAIVFTLCSSGERTKHIVPRASTKKIIENGDMVSFGLAVMYEGYTATCQIPFAVGDYSKETWQIIDALIRAWKVGVSELRPGNPMKNIVSAVRNCFRREKLDKYDLYPPLHGCGLAEAENPYPDENRDRAFEVGMTFNTDISLFGAAGGSNRIEAGYMLSEQGYEAITPYVDEYCEKWLAERKNSKFCAE